LIILGYHIVSSSRKKPVKSGFLSFILSYCIKVFQIILVKFWSLTK